MCGETGIWKDGRACRRQESISLDPSAGSLQSPPIYPPCNFMVCSSRCTSDWKVLGDARMFFLRETYEHPTLRLLSSRLHSFLGTPHSELVYTFASRLNHHSGLTSWLDHLPGTCCGQFPRDVRKRPCAAAQSARHPQKHSLMSVFKSIKPHSLRPLSRGSQLPGGPSEVGQTFKS